MYVCVYVCEPTCHLGEDESRPTSASRTWLWLLKLDKKKKENKKKKKALRCERIISVLPQENHGKKTISLISARLINILPNV